MRDTQFGLELLDGFVLGFDRGFACALTMRHSNEVAWQWEGIGMLDDKGQRDNATTNQMNKPTDERTNNAGATWGDDVARRGDGGGRFSAPKAPHSSPLKHRGFGWLLCCFWLEDLSPPMGTPCRMTDMEMRWAKMMPKSDCLIFSDVHGYLYFDLVRYMKCTFSLW